MRLVFNCCHSLEEVEISDEKLLFFGGEKVSYWFDSKGTKTPAYLSLVERLKRISRERGSCWKCQAPFELDKKGKCKKCGMKTES